MPLRRGLRFSSSKVVGNSEDNDKLCRICCKLRQKVQLQIETEGADTADMGFILRHPWYLPGILILFLAFQNCGEGFKSKGAIGLSSLCTSKIMQAAKPLASASCQDIKQYICERRIFSSEVQNDVHTKTECSSSGGCLEVTTRYYDTSHLDQFEEYNRQETFCAHSHRVRGVAVFAGEGDSLSEALSLAASKCQGGS